MSSHSFPSPDDWDSHWERFAASAAQNPAQRMRHDFIARLLCKMERNRPVRILDLGSGQGDLMQKLDSLLPEASLLGAEMSRNGVIISQRKVPRATFIVADIFRPVPDLGRYEGWATHAVCSEVLEHVDDPTSFLEHARKYLGQDATLIVTVPAGPMSAFDRHIGHRQHFDQRKLRGIMEGAGYSVESIVATGFPFFNLYRLLVIAGGKRLTNDVKAQSREISTTLAGQLMKMFAFLFRANLINSRFGWQLVAVARKTSP
jgi:trans-aconitate methyltransferase